MPLVATLNGQRIVAPDVSPTEWLALKATYRESGLAMVCGKPGIPKTSRLGKQYFAHWPDSDCQAHEGGIESQEHRDAKQAVADTAAAAGWTATIECPSADRSWIADILVEKGKRRVAIEVQLAAQSDVEFTRRTSRYEADGVDTLWLVNARNLRAARTVPHHLLEVASETGTHTLTLPLQIARDLEPVELEKAIDLILNGGISQFMQVRTRKLLVSTIMRPCWKQGCGKWMSFWYLSGVEAETRCGEVVSVVGYGGFEPWQVERIEARVSRQVSEAFRESDLAPATFLTKQFSRVRGHEYLAQTCPHCNVFQGDGYLLSRPPHWVDFIVEAEVVIPLSLATRTQLHLCIDVDNGRCDQRALQPTAKALSGRVIPAALGSRYKELPPRSQQIWRSRRGPQTNQVGSRKRQPVLPPTPEPILIREPTSLDHIFEARWAALEPLCAKRPRRRPYDPNIPIAEMTRAQLWQELDNAILDLEAARVEQISAQRRSEGRPDNLSELLGEYYPAGP